MPRFVLVEATLDLSRQTVTVSPRLSDDVAFLDSMLDEHPDVLSGPSLHYPDRARREGVTGRVIVQAIIERDGHVDPASVRVIQRVDPDLDGSALAYVNRARFKPGKVRGKLVRTLVNLPIDFKITGRFSTFGRP